MGTLKKEEKKRWSTSLKACLEYVLKNNQDVAEDGEALSFDDARKIEAAVIEILYRAQKRKLWIGNGEGRSSQ